MQRQIAFGLALALALNGLPSRSAAAGCSFSNLLTLNVAVTTQDGNAVRDLKRDDFSLTENGRLQSIAAFTFQGPDLDSMPPATSQERFKFQYLKHRLITFLFDFTEMPRNERTRIQDDAIDFIRHDLKPGELLSIETMTAGSIETTQDFTNDQTALVAAVDRFRTPAGGVTAAKSDTSDAQGTLARITTVCEQLPIATRKSLLYFPAPIGNSGTGNQTLLDAAANACTKAGVAIYPIGTASVSALELATRTGGQAFSGRSAALDEVRRKTEAYYVLAYYTTDSRHDGGYRKVELKLTHPGLQPATLEYPHGYFAESPEPPPPPGVPQPLCF